MSVIDVMKMPADEVVYWSAYFEILRREGEKENRPGAGTKSY